LRRSAAILLATGLLLAGAPAIAAEKGQMIRAGDLLAQPFIDAASTAKLTAAQPVTIVERRGPWVSVQAGGKTGWVRLLNLRLEPAAGMAGLARPAGSKPSGMSSLSSLTTNSSGRTVTTGVKGMDEEDIRGATPNYVELTLLDGLGVEAADARTNAANARLVERSVDYLDKKRGK
jgi:Bacterial SH3 domain